MELELIKNFFIGKQLCGIEYTQFPDGERKINIIKGKHKEIRHSDLKESEAVLLHSLINDKSIIDLCLILNALSYNDSVDSIYLTIPYMGYARQDRQNAIGECVSVIAILRMILAQTNKIKSISFCDIHNPEIFSELPSGIVYKNIYPHIATDYITGFLEELSKYKYITLDNVTFVACDAGGATRARALNKAMKIKHDIAIIDKERKEDGEVEMSNILGETVQDRICIIVEDIVDSAGTLCKSAELLKANGAKDTYAFITHGIFSGNAIEKINNSQIKKIFVTDTHPFDKKDSKKIETVAIRWY